MAFERITVNPERMGGKPCLRDLRVTVTMVLGQLAGGRTIEQVLADPATAWPLSTSAAAPLVTRRVAMWLAGSVVVAILIASALVGNFRATETRPVARFAYLLPEGQSFMGEGSVVAVAPDGSSIVYAAGDRLHRPRLSNCSGINNNPVSVAGS